jgi:arginine:ornithine antiporter/lysine permease
MANESSSQKFNLWTLTAMVVGSMVGAGIFSLPQTFGRVTGVYGSLIAWAISGTGMLMLTLVFQFLANRKPDLDAGVYAYAKAGFGNYWGFLSALGYWAGSCIGNVSYFILIKSTLGLFFPIFGEGNTVPAVLISSAILWTIHFMILRGVKKAAALNTIVTIAKVIPIFIFLVIVGMNFNSGIFHFNLSGGLDAGSLFSQVRGTMLVSVFVFLGVEGASVYSRYAKNRSDVGRATILGFLGVLCLMILVTTLSFGVMQRTDLTDLRNPSMTGVLEHVVGRWGAIFVSAGLIISVLGAYLSWSLLAAEVPYSAAQNGTMPAFLARENHNHVPAAALWLTNITVQTFLILTLFARYAFTLALELTSSMNLIPYLLVAGYALKLVWSGETYEREPSQRRRDLVIAAGAVIYTAWLLWAAGMKFLLLSAVIYAPGTILYFLARREQHRFVFTPKEKLAFVAAGIAAVVGIYGIASGSITI